MRLLISSVINQNVKQIDWESDYRTDTHCGVLIYIRNELWLIDSFTRFPSKSALLTVLDLPLMKKLLSSLKSSRCRYVMSFAKNTSKCFEDPIF